VRKRSFRFYTFNLATQVNRRAPLQHKQSAFLPSLWHSDSSLCSWVTILCDLCVRSLCPLC
jgi:hypothetical protein